jgi:DNA-binding transcriptional MerR regulator
LLAKPYLSHYKQTYLHRFVQAHFLRFNFIVQIVETQIVETQIVETQSIKRLYYSISEVSQLVDEEQYVLRYWETEFEQLRPQKNRAGNRIYIEKDVELLRTIKHLLRDKRYTIDGAKEHLRSLSPPSPNIEVPSETHTEHNLPASVEAASRETAQMSAELIPNGLHSDLIHTELPEKIFIPVALPTMSVRDLSHDELVQMRDTLRELLHLLDSLGNLSLTA